MTGDKSPEQIQQEIEGARQALAASLDQLVERTSPKRLADQGKQKAIAWTKTPTGMAVLGGVGVITAFLIVRKIRSRG
ncbi:MAG: uncharacterized protein JWN61_2357 [Pseudonocardiales bacterium]|nr:uncharacterized protein [Pseudonocardiales bacterium]